MTVQLSRRFFLSASAAIGGGLSLGWSLPKAEAAETGAAELGIWATIAPDDTVTVRIARSEMGQGTLTGLAQLVADELDADWRFVKAEYVSPEANLANKRAGATCRPAAAAASAHPSNMSARVERSGGRC